MPKTPGETPDTEGKTLAEGKAPQHPDLNCSHAYNLIQSRAAVLVTDRINALAVSGVRKQKGKFP